MPAIAGTIKFGANLDIGYYDQEQQQLHPEKTVLDEVWDDHPEIDETQIRNLLGSFLFVGDDVYKHVSDLSGDKGPFELTKLSFEPINFLILDEPTNHLDIDSREVLEGAINDFDGTVLFISRPLLHQPGSYRCFSNAKDGITRYQGITMITYGRSPNKNKPAPTIQPPRTKKGPQGWFRCPTVLPTKQRSPKGPP